WLDDGALRLIFHKSFRGLSINSHDIATYFPPGFFLFFTFAILVSMIAKAGKGSYLTQFDAQDAYKQLIVRLADLFQQVFRVGEDYYVDFCACFGSLYGNDIYSAFGHAHCVCLAKAAKTPLLRNYVDNYMNITPDQGPGTEGVAK